MTFVTTSTAINRKQATIPNCQFCAWIKGLAVEFAHRQSSMREISSLDERRLRDVGLTRNDIDAVKHLPLDTDAAAELQHISKSRARNW